jgi:hypothetical protein
MTTTLHTTEERERQEAEDRYEEDCESRDKYSEARAAHDDATRRFGY